MDQDDTTSTQHRVVETWHEVANAVTQATRDAFPSSPPFDAADPAPFQAYWRDVFARLHDRVVSDPAIPETLTSPRPGGTTFSIMLFRNCLGCPCILPEVEPDITLLGNNAEGEDGGGGGGVTKGDLVRGLMDYLYGGDQQLLPLIHSEWEGEAPEQDAGRLIYRANWISTPSPEGVEYAYGDKTYNIWMYCCRWDEFEGKSAENTEGSETPDETPEENEPKAHL